MEKYLLVSSSEKASAALKEILAGSGQVKIDVAESVGAARRALIDNEYDLVMINAPLTDENGLDFSCDVSVNSDCGVLLMVKAELTDQIQEKVEPFGVFVVPKPVNRQVLNQALKFISASQQRILSMNEKLRKLQRSVEELKIMNLAKCLLIQHHGLSEKSAHRYIEKKAMDSRKPKRLVAESIVKEYQDK